MCLSPIMVRIKKAEERVGVPRLSISDYKAFCDGSYRFKYVDYSLNEFHYVPCGKCLECMKRRADAHAFKLYKSVEHCSSLYHLTLTYSPDHLPFAAHYVVWDNNLGQYCDVSNYLLLEDCDLLQECRSSFSKPGKLPICFEELLYSDGDFDYIRRVTPSLNRKDVRNLLKQVRVEYKRKYGVLAEFVYSFCGEYGPQTNRPHYHLCLASEGDISTFVALFNASWKKKFGFTVVRHVKRFNSDKTDAFAIVSRYISKYISKGEYENPAALAGYCERGRVCQSCFMCKKDFDGVSLFDKYLDVIRDYHLCFDIYGKYNLRTLRFDSTQQRLSLEQLTNLVNQIRERLVVNFGCCSVAMPRFIKDRIFSYKDFNGKLKYYEIYQFVADSIQEFYTEREAQNFNRAFKQKDGDTKSTVSVLNRSKDWSSEIRKKRLKENYERFLSKSCSNL